jgi:hypothetical protein
MRRILHIAQGQKTYRLSVNFLSFPGFSERREEDRIVTHERSKAIQSALLDCCAALATTDS